MNATYTFYDSVGVNLTINMANNNGALPDDLDPSVVKCLFAGTSVELTCWVISGTGNQPGSVGFKVQNASSSTGPWTDTTAFLSLQNQAGVLSVSTPGAPTVPGTSVFFRLAYINTTSSDTSCSLRNLVLTVKN